MNYEKMLRAVIRNFQQNNGDDFLDDVSIPDFLGDLTLEETERVKEMSLEVAEELKN